MSENKTYSMSWIEYHKGINYKYNNRSDSYTDPEYFKIKKQTINLSNSLVLLVENSD